MKKAIHLRPVGLTDIPRADAEIKRTIGRLRVAQFEIDPLFHAARSFQTSLCTSAQKREGRILEAAIKDAIEQTTYLRLVNEKCAIAGRRRQIDVAFELCDHGWLVGLELKRGSKHDSTKIRQFRTDLMNIPALLRTALPLFPFENVHFHIVFIDGQPPIKEGLNLDDLGRLYGLHARSHIWTARQRYSAAIDGVLRERGL